MGTTFADRLARLFDTVYPPGRGPHTAAEVVAALKSEGVNMSAPYLSQLRKGNRTNPSHATIEALARFFRISPDYFLVDAYYEKLDAELTWLADMRDPGVRQIAAKVVGLSVAAQRNLLQTADELRRSENLSADTEVFSTGVNVEWDDLPDASVDFEQAKGFLQARLDITEDTAADVLHRYATVSGLDVAVVSQRLVAEPDWWLPILQRMLPKQR